jgi:hypothetical protein
MPKALHVAVAIAALTTVLAPNAARNPATSRHPSEQCTVAEPATQATLEIQMPYAADFCELISHALAGDVFHAPLLVTPGRTWHYPGTTITCRLHHHSSRDRLTIRNSPATCHWLNQHATGWKQKPTR